ncbi:MAG: polymer-forming cytoskeletal protein [Nitrospirota bacterium]
MFSKWGISGENIKTEGNGTKEKVVNEITPEKTTPIIAETKSGHSNINRILKGSKLSGDINVTCDLELSGDVEGNIRSAQDSNILIKGSCKGNIETAGGSVDIDGELISGNIVAGSNVTISGKFNGGEIKAQGRVYVNGEFNGKLEGNEIEIGPNAVGKGDLLYKEFISISKGAKVDVHISRLQEGLKVVGKPPVSKTENVDAPAKEKSAAN